MSRHDPNRPKVTDVRALVEGIYERHLAGCCLHIVLDDGNVEDSSVQYCLDNAEHDDCRRCAELLLKMSPTQRRKAARYR